MCYREVNRQITNHNPKKQFATTPSNHAEYPHELKWNDRKFETNERRNNQEHRVLTIEENDQSPNFYIEEFGVQQTSEQQETDEFGYYEDDYNDRKKRVKALRTNCDKSLGSKQLSCRNWYDDSEWIDEECRIDLPENILSEKWSVKQQHNKVDETELGSPDIKWKSPVINRKKQQRTIINEI